MSTVCTLCETALAPKLKQGIMLMSDRAWQSRDDRFFQMQIDDHASQRQASYEYRMIMASRIVVSCRWIFFDGEIRRRIFSVCPSRNMVTSIAHNRGMASRISIQKVVRCRSPSCRPYSYEDACVQSFGLSPFCATSSPHEMPTVCH